MSGVKSAKAVKRGGRVSLFIGQLFLVLRWFVPVLKAYLIIYVLPPISRRIMSTQAGCGTCGGPGCGLRGGSLTGDDCCHSNILTVGNLCSVTGKAPCIIDGKRWVAIGQSARRGYVVFLAAINDEPDKCFSTKTRAGQWTNLCSSLACGWSTPPPS